MSTLDFVPRSVKQRKVDIGKPLAPLPGVHASPSSTSPKPSIVTETENTTRIMPLPQSNKKKKKKKNQQPDAKPSLDFAFLVWLSISDYSLWADGDLRRRIMDSDVVVANVAGKDGEIVASSLDDNDSMVVDENESQNLSDDAGYVPLEYLLNQSPAFRLVSTIQPYSDLKEGIYVNSLRQYAKEELDVRFIVDPESSSTSRAAVHGNRKRKPKSGYEVRRKDFASFSDSEFSRYSKANWDALTVYMENIPIQYAKVSGIAKLTTALLPAANGSTMKRVQNIFFPAHHQDRPGSIPTCKGFALVTLSTIEDVQALIDAWAWDSEEHASSSKIVEAVMDVDQKTKKESAEVKSAKSSGLKICTKARWKALRAEYLLYRQQLVEEINQHQDAEDVLRRGKAMDKRRAKDLETEDKVASGSKRKQPETTTTTKESQPGIHPDSQYPTGCLVFVRHVHPDTNKTTLRTLFSQAWKQGEDAMDYIDYSRNMDSCYVRLGTPSHAEFFVDYFSSLHLVQSSGLDAVGSEVSASANDAHSELKHIVPEIVLGKREELYWDKIPVKLKKQALEKKLKAMYGSDFTSNSGAIDATDEKAQEEGNGGGRRKRRRRGQASE